MLDEIAIRAHLKSEISPKITVLKTINSTNTYLLGQPLKHGHVCLAELQTDGRGRQGRVWVSPEACNIYLSILWEVPRTDIGGLSLVAGMSVAQALQNLGVEGIKLKWPNDIVYQGRKLGGILIEVRERKTNSVWVVIGIGINVEMPSSTQIDQPWIDIAQITEKTANLSRNIIVATLLNNLFDQLNLFASHGLIAVQQYWQDADALFDRAIKVTHNGNTIMGIARGINSQGELLVLSQNEIIPINSGEVLNIKTD
jgi:BirA family biotin operon repressor/biotin-[acetyl-CoA-carboxylase] ligase